MGTPGEKVSDQVDPVSKILREFTEQAERGELAAIAIGFIRKDGGASVQSTPMAAATMNHLWRLFDRKVSRLYDMAVSAAERPRSPTGAVRAQSPTAPAVQLPRKVRRQVEAKQRKMQKKAAKKSKLNGPPLPPEPQS